MPEAAGQGAIPTPTPPSAAAGQGAVSISISRGEAADRVDTATTIREVGKILKITRMPPRLHDAIQEFLNGDAAWAFNKPELGLPWITTQIAAMLRGRFVEGGRRRRRTVKRKHFRKRTSRRT